MVRCAQAALLVVAVVLACARESPPPGELLGAFVFQASEQNNLCSFSELPMDGGVGGFGFTASFRAEDGGPTANLTVDGRERQGTFDGRRFESIYPGPSDDPVTRTFEVGACENRFLVEETLRAVFLTERQLPSDAGCPDDFDALYDAGGLVDPDAGVILPPSRGPDGYDAARVCGVLIEDIQPAQACDEVPDCTLTYRVDGKRTD
jgi:hypothetical protein